MHRIILFLGAAAMLSGCDVQYDNRRVDMYEKCVNRGQMPDACTRAVNALLPPRKVG